MSFQMVRLTDEDRKVQERQADALESIAESLNKLAEKGLYVDARQI